MRLSLKSFCLLLFGTLLNVSCSKSGSGSGGHDDGRLIPAGALTCGASRSMEIVNGCQIEIKGPNVNGESLTLPYRIEWIATGCEPPFSVQFLGEPASDENSVTEAVPLSLPNSKSAASLMIYSFSGAALRSASGRYEFQVQDAKGAKSESRVFFLNGQTCR